MAAFLFRSVTVRQASRCSHTVCLSEARVAVSSWAELNLKFMSFIFTFCTQGLVREFGSGSFLQPHSGQENCDAYARAAHRQPLPLPPTSDYEGPAEPGARLKSCQRPAVWILLASAGITAGYGTPRPPVEFYGHR